MVFIFSYCFLWENITEISNAGQLGNICLLLYYLSLLFYCQKMFIARNCCISNKYYQNKVKSIFIRTNVFLSSVQFINVGLLLNIVMLICMAKYSHYKIIPPHS